MKSILFILLLFPCIGFSQKVIAVSLSPAEKVYIEPIDTTNKDKYLYHYQIGSTCHAVYEDKEGLPYFTGKDRYTNLTYRVMVKPINKDRIRNIN